MRVLCVARHRFLSEHLCGFFAGVGVVTVPAVGVAEAADLLRVEPAPDVVICDYDLLAAVPLRRWHTDPTRRGIPVLAVSLNRDPGEPHLTVDGIAAFLYLPTLQPAQAHRVLLGLRRDRGAMNAPLMTPWPAATSRAAHLR